MSKFYIEDPSQIYGCLRCGKIMGKLNDLNDGYIICGECNENGIVSFVQTLDILNDLHVRGELSLNREEEDWEEYMEFIEELEDEDE